MKIAIPKEIMASEQRVALVPTLVTELNQLGCSVLLEQSAGLGAGYTDSAYLGVELYPDSASLYANADIILKVQPPTVAEVRGFKKNAILVSFLYPNRDLAPILALRDTQITSFAMEYIPRISRAQAMDALSSQATVAGYKAVLIAANSLKRFFPMLTTAAGTIRPVNLLVIGTGVAGLQAIATARRLGAVVSAYDVRSATKEQVESLGAKMLNTGVQADSAGGYARELTAEEQQQQQSVLAEAIAKSAVIISTASIPGKLAPKIISQAMVESMAFGSVIIDVAADSGGNCELTQPGSTVEHHGVTIHGPSNLPSLVAHDASNMYAKNLVNFLRLCLKNQTINLEWEDPILAQSVVTVDGHIRHPLVKSWLDKT